MNLNEKKIMFLGDSITHQGQYTALVEAVLLASGVRADVYNFGVSSENMSGLTEAQHPFPRPNIFNRLDRVLKEVKPDVVVALYGVNDSIYYPYAKYIEDAYQTGVLALLEKLNGVGATVVICTPTYFDLPSLTSMSSDTLEGCVGGALYSGCDDILKRFSAYVKGLPQAKIVADVHAAMELFFIENRKKNKAFKCGDGIHPSFLGAVPIAKAILEEGFQLKPNFDTLLKNRKFMSLYRATFNLSLYKHNFYIEKIGHENLYKCKTVSERQFLQKSKKLESKLQKKLTRI